jgi:hypothetical protein
LRHHDRGPQGLHHRLLRLDLALPPHWGTHLGERGFETLHLGIGRAQIGALLLDELLGCREGLHEGFGAPQIGLDLVARRLGIREARLGLLDLGRLAGGLEIGELLFGLLELPRGLVARRNIGGVVLVEQRRARRDPRAARHRERGEEALLGRTDFDEIGLRIALPFGRRGRPSGPPPAGTAGRGYRQNRCHGYQASVHGLDLL